MPRILLRPLLAFITWGFLTNACLHAQSAYVVCENDCNSIYVQPLFPQDLHVNIVILTDTNSIPNSHGITAFCVTRQLNTAGFSFNIGDQGIVTPSYGSELKTLGVGPNGSQVYQYRSTNIGTYVFPGNNFPLGAWPTNSNWQAPPVITQFQFNLDQTLGFQPTPLNSKTVYVVADYHYTKWYWASFLGFELPYTPGASKPAPTNVTVYFDLRGPGAPAINPYQKFPSCPSCGCGGSSPSGSGGSSHLATASLDRLQAGIAITDTPISFQPAVGSRMGFTVSYHQRLNTQSANPTYSNLGPQWTSSWLTYISGGPTDGQSNATYNAADGSQYDYEGYEPTVAQGQGALDLNEGTFQTYDGWTHATLRYYGPGINSPNDYYERDLPDGTIEMYGQSTTSLGHHLYFLTSITDPQNNKTTLNYDPNAAANGLAVLTSVSAPTGGVSSQAGQLVFSYDPNNPLLIAKVTRLASGTDPGASALFQYTNGQLTSITDPIGITSYYHYSTGTNFIDTMTTPYGNTVFNSQDGSGFLEADLTTPPDATNPAGLKERVEYWQTVPSGLMPSEVGPPSVSGATFDTNLNTANSFYWNRRAMADLGTTSPDSATGYSYAQITHWAQTDLGSIPVALSTKSSLEQRIWNGYQGQSNPSFVDLTIANSSSSASVTARVLDSGATQVSYASFNANGQIVQSTDPVGRVTNYSYDSTSPANDPTNYDLLQVTQSNSVTGGADVLSTMSNYTMHLPQTVKDAAGQFTSLVYNAQGQTTSRTVTVGGSPQVTTMTYGGPGGTGSGNYLDSVTGPISGATTSYTYDYANRVQTVTDSEAYKITTSYDALDRPITVAYPDTTTDLTAYHILDVDHTTDRQGRITSNTYDSIRQILTTTDPLGRITKYGWCTCGSLASLTDANGNVTQWGLDREGRVTSKTYADSTATHYVYENSTSRLSMMTNANSYVSTYTYNVDNTLAGTSYSGTNTPAVSFTYDPVYNRVKTMADGTGTTTYTYNPVNGALGAGRLASVSVPVDGTSHAATVSYTSSTGTSGYDELGRVVSRVIDSTNYVGMTYDALGRVTNVTNALAPTSPGFQYGYVHTTSRVASVTYPSSTGLSVTNSYYANSIGDGTGDEDQRLSEIKNMSGTNQLSDFKYTYNRVGTIATWQQQTNSTSAAVTNTISYDNADQMTKDAQSGSSTNAYGYYYDPAGNRLSETVNSATTVAGRFNSVNQLMARITSPASTNVVGNASAAITNATVNAVPATISNSTNFTASVAMPAGTNLVSVVAQPTAAGSSLTTQRYQVVITGTAPTTLTYDSEGNVLTDQNGNTYQWDALNRLIRITYPSTAYTSFAYDGLSRRSQIAEYNSSHTLTSTKNYLWIGSEIAEERDASNNVTKRFFPQGEQQAGTNYYYTRDHLGSVRELCDSGGSIKTRYSYDPYGRTTLVSGSNLATFQYANYYQHQASGLCLTRAGLPPSTGRPFDSNTGRWLSRDPLSEEGGLNLYGYVSNDPIIYADKFGLWDGSSPDYYPTIPRPKDPCPCAEWQLIDSQVAVKKVYVTPKPKSIWEAWKNWYPDSPEHYAKYIYISIGLWFCPTNHTKAITGTSSEPGVEVPPNDSSPKVAPPFVGPPAPKTIN